MRERETIDHDARYAAYDLTWRDKDPERYTREFLDGIPLANGAKVLDFGAGTGLVTEGLKRIDPSITVDALDIRESVRDELVNKGADEVLIGDIRKMDLSGKGYDHIIACRSLMHLPKESIPAVLRQLSESLNPDGTIHTEVFSSAMAGQSKDQLVRQGFMNDRWKEEFNPQQIDELFRRADLHIHNSREYSWPGFHTDITRIDAHKM